MTNTYKNILIKTILWFATLFFICFFGISHPKAYALNDMTWLNRKMGDFPFTTWYDSFGDNYQLQYFMFSSSQAKPNYFIVNACATGGISFDISNVTSGSITYIGSISFDNSPCKTSNNYNGQQKRYYFKLNSWDNDGTNSSIMYRAFVKGTSSWTTNVTFTSYEFTDTSDYETLKQQQQSNQAIIDSNSSMTNSITNNQNQNTQDIINNQNTNTQQQIESQQVCTYIDKNNVGENDRYISGPQGTTDSSANHIITDYIPIDKNTIIKVLTDSSASNTYYCFYNVNTAVISCNKSNTLTENNVLTIPSGANYFRATISKGLNKPTFQICKNGNQAISDQNKEAEKTRKGILGKLGELISNLFSTDDADVSGLENMVGWLPPGPLDSIINLPLTLFNSLTNVLSGTCTPVSLTLPFVNKNLVLPCFDTFMSQYLTGFSTIWVLVGTIVSIFILYNYLLSLYKWVDDTLTLRENNLPGYYDDNWGGGA